MKKKGFILFSLLCFCLGASAQLHKDDPAIITIDGEPVYKSEFEYIYNKNNSNASEKKSVDEYLDLFINYKLKVVEAKERKYDKNPHYLEELDTYRKQLAIPYIIDDATRDNLVEEAYQRSKTSIACSHILIKPNHKDSIPPIARITRIYNELKNGAAFDSLARIYSDCGSARNGGYLGYANVFDMVYPFENVMYNTKVSEFSKPFTTEFGYHIVKVNDRKPHFTMAKISQIFISSSTKNAHAKADSLYKIVSKKPKKFNKISAANSENFFSGTKDGIMPWITKGQGIVPPSVEDEVFSMSKVGDIREFYVAPMGYMIARLDSTSLDLPESQFTAEITEKVLNSDRANVIANSFLANLANRTSYQLLDSAALYDFVPLVRDSTFDVTNYKALLEKPLFTMLDIVYPQSNFFNVFLQEKGFWINANKGIGNRAEKQKYVGVTSDSGFVLRCYDDYINRVMKQVAYDDIENNNLDYHNLLQEYSDGLLLYTVSNEVVWTKALRDNGGLDKFFSEHRSDYKWSEPHFVGQVIYCKDVKTKQKVDKLYASFNGNIPVNIDSVLHVMFKVQGDKDVKKADAQISFRKTSAYKKGKNKAVDYYVFKTTDSCQVEHADFPEVSVYGKETTEPTEFDEFRGALVADYQASLDKKWIERLRSKHDVVVHKDVVATVVAK